MYLKKMFIVFRYFLQLLALLGNSWHAMGHQVLWATSLFDF